MHIEENLLFIKNKLPKHICLVAVSKTKPIEAITEAYKAGQKVFGENYVQELVEKQHHLPKDIEWHFIGHLQSNKVKYIAPFVSLIHGVDSFSLLKEINKQAQKNNRVINCLLQLYIAKEETKFGLSFDEAKYILESEEYTQLKNITVNGFMAMASNTNNLQQVKTEFLSVLEFSKSVSHKISVPVLSYGMSSDYELAIDCGSNMIRVGSSIFGERKYTK